MLQQKLSATHTLLTGIFLWSIQYASVNSCAYSGIESMGFDYDSGTLYVGDLKNKITLVDVRAGAVVKVMLSNSQC